MIITPPWNRRGVIFSLQLWVCLCVCVSVCVSGSAYEQNSSRTDEPIWTLFSLNGCLRHWLKLYWMWCPWVKSQGHSDVMPTFLHNSLLTSLPYISALLCLIKMKFGMSLRYPLGQFVFKFHKNRMGDDVIVISFRFSLNNCPYLKFYWTYKFRTWNTYTTTQLSSNDINESDLDGRWRSQAKVKGHKNELMVISRKLLHSQTSYLVPRHNTTSDI